MMSRMKILAVSIFLALAVAAPAAAQQHWLMGTWSGSLTNVAINNRFGADRSLEVKSVSADGTKAQASWISGAGTYQIPIAISGNEISFTTPGNGGANYKLTHNAGTLSGSWSPSGGGTRGGNVTLKKQ